MYQVEGFTFESKEMADKARREAEGIRYIKKQMPMDDPGVVLKLYHKLLEQGIFETCVGIVFLYEVQDYLYSCPEVSNEYVLPIPVKAVGIPELRELAPEEQPQEKTQEDGGQDQAKEPDSGKKKDLRRSGKKAPDGKNYRRAYHVTLFFAIVFLAVIAGFFIITYFNGKNKSILNYENEIINKYEAWETQLNEREEILREREEAVAAREAIFEGRTQE